MKLKFQISWVKEPTPVERAPDNSSSSGTSVGPGKDTEADIPSHTPGNVLQQILKQELSVLSTCIFA